MNTKTTILALITTLVTASAFASPTPPIVFNAGQGTQTVTAKSKMTTMGMTMDLPDVIMTNVIKPKSQAEFCSEAKKHKPNTAHVQMKIATCTFDGTSGVVKGSINMSGSVTKVVYNYRFH